MKLEVESFYVNYNLIKFSTLSEVTIPMIKKIWLEAVRLKASFSGKLFTVSISNHDTLTINERKKRIDTNHIIVLVKVIRLTPYYLIVKSTVDWVKEKHHYSLLRVTKPFALFTQHNIIRNDCENPMYIKDTENCVKGNSKVCR